MSFGFRYWAFGLHIESEFEFPELSESDTGDRTDLVVRLGAVPDHLERPECTGHRFEVQDKVCLLQTARTARMKITAGEEIVVQPGENAPMPTVRGLVLAWGLTVCLYQRKRLLFHGATLVKDGLGIILCGRNGAGKSSLAMDFVNRGYSLFDDNLSCVDVGSNEVTVYPGSSRVKLWQDSLDARKLDSSSLDPVLYKAGKYIVPVEESRPNSARIHGVYTLLPDEANELSGRIERLAGVRKLESLRKNIFLVHFCVALGGMSELMKQLFCLAKHVPVYELDVSEPRPSTRELVKLIEGNHEPTHWS